MNLTEAEPGPVLIGIEGTTLTAADRETLKHPLVGGVVLFTRNFENLLQLQLLNGAIRSVAAANLVICVDHEGGRVQRFREGFTALPPLAVLGRMYSDSASTACDFAYRHGRVMATELLLSGVDHSFAPVLDLDIESCVIGDRSFAADAQRVTDLGRHYLAGMHDAGMRACAKHFPGHGSVLADSHTDDVIDKRSWDAIAEQDLVPFRALAADYDAVMMAHVCYPEVDSQPAGYSRRWIREILQEDVGFEGLVLSDDLGMHAAVAAGTLRERTELSLAAGCDAVLVCQPEDVATLLREWGDHPVTPCPDLLALQGRAGVTREELSSVSEWRHWQESLVELEQSKWA
jgi:beta-N-acetylhexosaminidase